MKLTKRILAMALCVMMILGLSATAFASEGHNHTVTIDNPNEGYEYYAYQIFAGDLGSDGVLSNITWGEGVNGETLLAKLQTLDAFAACQDAKDVAKVLSGYSYRDDARSIEFAEIVDDYLVAAKGVKAVWDAEDHKYYVTGLEDGYYLVKNTAVPDGTNTTVSRYVLEVVRNVVVSHKGEFPTITKKIEEAGQYIDYNAKGVGKVEKYHITGTLPSNIALYDSYQYNMVDTLSKGLTFNGDMVITVNGVDVTKYFYITVNGTPCSSSAEMIAALKDGEANVITAGMDLKALEYDTDANGDVIGVGKLQPNYEVVMTYTATVNEHAVIGIEGNPNDVYLEYDRDPNKDTPPPKPGIPVPVNPDGETPPDRVITFATELKITKYDGAGNLLTGAEFTLKGQKDNIYIVTKGIYRLIEGSETGTHWKLKDQDKWTTVAPAWDDPATTDVIETTYDKYDLPADYTAEYHPANYILDEKQEVVTESETVEVKGYVNDQGVIVFSGMGPGKYTLTESVTPTGYNTISPIEFEVLFNAKNFTFSTTNSEIMVDTTNNVLYANIVNVAGTTLPSTGGVGTTLFYIFGSLMFIGAAVLLITKKRMAF